MLRLPVPALKPHRGAIKCPGIAANSGAYAIYMEMINMEIRLAVPGDFRAIRQYDRHIPSPRLADCIGSGQVYVLKDAGKIIGVLRYSLFWQTIPFLDLLYLDSRCRGQGHGRDMLAHWEAVMAKAGYAYVMLSTQEDETAKYFYEKLGYRLIGAFLPPEQEARELLYGKQLAPCQDAPLRS